MARRISSSQLKSKLRQLESKHKQAQNNLNRAIQKYNQEVRAYNSRVRANRQRVLSEFSKLNRHSTTSTRYVVFRTSVNTLHRVYVNLEDEIGNLSLSSQHDELLDLSEKENANSIELMNALLGDENHYQGSAESLRNTNIGNELKNISGDLDNRWRGAIFSLDVRNPDAARHFCASSREIFTQILESGAPDASVLAMMPDCDKTASKKPTRRAKIKYLLHNKGMEELILEEFVEQDMENIVQLFRVLNDGTHGFTGVFDLHQLIAIKKRVEDGILFLSRIVS